MKANEVEELDDSVTGLVERMRGLMSEARGVGLAAPQLGILRRVLVYQTGEDEPFVALVNPRVVETGEEQLPTTRAVFRSAPRP
jgi:peptide deformylase